MKLCVFFALATFITPLQSFMLRETPEHQQAVARHEQEEMAENTKEVIKVIRKVKKEAQRQEKVAASAPKNLLCRKDRSKPCPRGWAFNAERHKCIAPPDYAATGYCPAEATFTSIKQMKQWERTCGVTWPCVHHDSAENFVAEDDPVCRRNYAWPCPTGWLVDTSTAPSSCTANHKYRGACSRNVAFASPHAKQEFAAHCDLSWPCEDDAPSMLVLGGSKSDDAFTIKYQALKIPRGVGGPVEEDSGNIVPQKD